LIVHTEILAGPSAPAAVEPLLGLKRSEVLHNGYYTHDEIARLQILMGFIKRNNKEWEVRREIISSQFCALYLPELVSRYLDPPPLQDVTDEEFTRHYQLYNAYIEMMVHIQDSPYFTKYLRSNKPLAAPGKRLPSVLAQRLLDLAPDLDLRMRSPTHNRPAIFWRRIACSCVALLCTLLAVFIKVPDLNVVINADIRQGLSVWLTKWHLRYSSIDPVLEMWFVKTCCLLCPSTAVKNKAKLVRRRFKNLDECALPICSAKDGCKICSKCKTVAYCSVVHQRSHWNFPTGAPHRELCHETQY